MRTARPLVLAPILLVIAACTSTTPGWTYAPAPPATPLPSASSDASGAPSGEPSAAPSGEPSAAPSGEPSAAPSDGGGGTVVQVSATNIAWDQAQLTVPAGQPCPIEFANNDAGVPHNVEIVDGSGAKPFVSDTFPGVETRTFEVAPLNAGNYQFICIVHPNMVGTLVAS